MSTIPVNDGQRIRDILGHVAELPDEARYPLAHYKWATNQAWLLRDYFGHKVTESDRYPEIGEEHLTSLDAMLVVHFVEAFERFLKEIAAICVDHLAPCVLDDRFDDFFTLKGSVLAAHFGAESVGASLCESSTWTDCKTVNDRFRKMLATPFESKQGDFYVFPSQGQAPADERFRHEHMMLIWQLRHTLVHNLGLVTKSDAIKLSLLVKANVEPRKLLRPTKDDLRHISSFSARQPSLSIAASATGFKSCYRASMQKTRACSTRKKRPTRCHRNSDD